MPKIRTLTAYRRGVFRKRKRSSPLEDVYDSEEDGYTRVSYRKRRVARTGEYNRLTVGELRSNAIDLMPIYELLEDSVAVEQFLKKRISEFTYLQDKFSQMTVDQIVKYWDGTDADTKLALYTKIASLFADMKKIAKEVNKDIRKEYTSTLASQYTVERIMMIFRKAAAGMKSYKGRAKYGTTNKAPDVVLSEKQQNMRKLLKGVKVGSSEATTKMKEVVGTNVGSRSKLWKRCLTALEAICVDPVMRNVVTTNGKPTFIFPYTIHKKWGVQPTALSMKLFKQDPEDDMYKNYFAGGKGAIEMGVSGVQSSYLGSTHGAKKIFYQ